MNAPLSPYATLPAEAVRWLANGARGVSSNALISAMFGIDALRDWQPDAPHDPSDFRRCRLMVEAIPGGRETLLSMVDFRAPPRARLALLKTVENWDLLCGIMDAECPDWREAREGHAPLMRRTMRRMWDEVDAHIRAHSPDNHNTTGEDRQDPLVGIQRRDIDTEALRRRIQDVMEMPQVSTKLPASAAFALLKDARAALEQLASLDDDGGANDHSEAAQEVLRANRNFDRTPRTQADAQAVRLTLSAYLEFLYSQSRPDAEGGMNDHTEGVHGIYMRLKRQVERAAAGEPYDKEETTPAASPQTTIRRHKPR